MLEKTVQFRKGRVLIAGQWTPRPEIFYCAARRTLQEERDFSKKYWAHPDRHISTKSVQNAKQYIKNNKRKTKRRRSKRALASSIPKIRGIATFQTTTTSTSNAQ